MSSQYVILNDEALLHISGPDSLTFLQGQTTCDTRCVDAQHAIPGAYCTPKGRVVCDFLLCELTQDHYALRMRRDILDASAAVFGKYIVFSKAELDTDRVGWQLFACWGDDAGAQLHSAVGSPPRQDNSGERYASVCGEGFVLIQTDAEGKQFECYINTETHPELAQQLFAAMSPGNVNDWLNLQLEQGVARIEAATIEAFIPQMLNYDLTGHVDFKKGCYTGQEVVARMHYRGTPKRRLFRASMTEKHALQAGTALYSADSSQSTGTLVNSALDVSGLPVALIVAPVNGAEPGLHLDDSNGAVLSYNSTG